MPCGRQDLVLHGAEAHHSTWWRARFQALRDNRRATPRTLRTEAPWAILGSWAALGLSWAALGPSGAFWSRLGQLLGRLGGLLGRLGRLLGRLGRLLGRLGPLLGRLGPLLGRLGLHWASQEEPKRRQDEVGGYPLPKEGVKKRAEEEKWERIASICDFQE